MLVLLPGLSHQALHQTAAWEKRPHFSFPLLVRETPASGMQSAPSPGNHIGALERDSILQLLWKHQQAQSGAQPHPARPPAGSYFGPPAGGCILKGLRMHKGPDTQPHSTGSPSISHIMRISSKQPHCYKQLRWTRLPSDSCVYKVSAFRAVAKTSCRQLD